MAELTKGQKISAAIKKHGMVGTRTYTSWDCMKDRCTRKTHKSYKYYGGRGISVCERWQSFENFFADMGERPPNKTLDRKDGKLGYFPSNCVWSDRKTQNSNRTIIRRISEDSLVGFARRVGISKQSMWRRMKRWPKSRWFEEKRKW